MSSTAEAILKAIDSAGDMSLEEISGLIPRKHNDHRDFYVFACLVRHGLIDDGMHAAPTEAVGERQEPKEQLMSWKYFAMSTADKTATYKGRTWSIHGGGETLKGQRFALSAKGHFLLSEQSTKRYDRAFSIGSGMLIGIVVALAAVLIERYAKGA